MIIKTKAYKHPERYGINNLNESDVYSHIEISSSKILVSRTEKRISKIFEWFIITLIIISSIVLMIYNPLSNPDSVFIKILIIIDFIITIMFFIEAILKILACGFLFSSYPGITPYIRNGWNILDFFVVVISIVDLYLEYFTGASNAGSLKSLKALRAIRALRPLRMINRNEGLRVATQALLSSIPAMQNVLILCILFLVAFSVLGVGFFKGTFYYCRETASTMEELGLIRIQILIMLGNAILTLFQIMTTEGWQDVMFSGVDAEGVEMQPIYSNNTYFSLFFIIFIILGSFIIINFFTATIVDNFNQIKEKEEIGYGLMVTDAQRQWIEVQTICLRNKLIFKPRPPTNKIRKWFYTVATSRYLDIFITIVVVLNTFVMGMRYAEMSDQYSLSLDILNYIFTFIYNIELIIKFIGLGFRYVTAIDFNTFDCLCVLASDISIIISFFISSSLQSIVVFARAFRVVKIMRLTKSFGKMLVSTMMYSLPQMKNIFLLLILLMLIYATLGVNLFSTVMYKSTYDEKNNFRNIFNAIVLLLRCSTGEDWDKVMYDLAKSDPYDNTQCVSDQSYTDMQKNGILGCGNQFSYIYFISFFIIVAMIVMNLSIGIFVDSIEAAKNDENSIIKKDIITDFFLNLWSEYDPDATGWISIDELVFFLYELPEPLGYGKEIPELSDEYEFGHLYERRKRENVLKAEAFTNNRKQKHIEYVKIGSIMMNGEKYISHEGKGMIIKETKAISIVKNLNIPIYEENKIHFKDVLTQCISNAFQDKDYQPGQKIQLKIYK